MIRAHAGLVTALLNADHDALEMQLRLRDTSQRS